MANSQDQSSVLEATIGPGSFGTKETVPVTPVNNLVVTSGPAKQEFSTASSDLAKMLAGLNGTPSVVSDSKDTPTIDNTHDSYTAMLDKLATSGDEATKALISSIQAGRMNQKNSIDKTYENYKSGLQLLGIQHNEAQATPDLLQGHIQQAENEHQAKITSLDIETNKALMDANKAKTEGNLAVLKEKMAYVKQLKDEKNNYLKNIADQMTAQKSIAESQATGYYDALQKLSPKVQPGETKSDQEKFIEALAKKNSISPASIVQALQTEKERREDRALKNAKTGSSSKLSVSEIKALQDIYPNAGIQYGMTESEAEALIKSNPDSQTATEYTAEDIKTNAGFSTKQLWNIALGSGVQRNTNLTRQDEINAFLTPENTAKIGKMIDAGYSPDDIEQFFKTLKGE